MVTTVIDEVLTAPVGEYLVEQHGELCILWRISEGEPDDGAISPAGAWWLLAA
jgi:hypothetical protein